jgi:hypothetical protein
MNKRMSARLAPVIGLGLLALSVGIIISEQNESQARAVVDAATNEKLQKLGAAIKAGDKAAIKDLTAALAKADVDDIMESLKTRTKGGIGVGKKGVIAPDGIELKLQAMGRDAPALAKEGDALEEMAYNIAAIAEAIQAHGPPKGSKGKKEDWAMWSKEMRDSSDSMLKAIKSKSSAEVKNIATKINGTCSACHTAFK